MAYSKGSYHKRCFADYGCVIYAIFSLWQGTIEHASFFLKQAITLWVATFAICESLVPLLFAVPVSEIYRAADLLIIQVSLSR